MFLDRDGTLVHSRAYPSQPRELRLYAGLGPGLRGLHAAGFLLVVVTNQSGVARGFFTEADLFAMHAHLTHELRRRGVQLDGIYYCPHHPDGVVPGFAVSCPCRKPAPGLLLRAGADLRVDLARSWLVGDTLSDVEAGNRAGCRTVLVDLGTEPAPEGALRQPDFVARDTPHALRLIGAAEQPGARVDRRYRPAAWPPRSG